MLLFWDCFQNYFLLPVLRWPNKMKLETFETVFENMKGLFFDIAVSYLANNI
jgi:hypothetical protein